MERELDLYKKVIELVVGECKYLHYGLFKPVDTISNAQQRSTDLIIDNLIKGSTLLEVGSGLGTTAKQLRDLGFTVDDIDKKKYHSLSNTINLPFEDVELSPNYYDVVLFQESAQYFNPQTIIEKSLAALKPEGQLLILDEFPRDFIDNIDKFSFVNIHKKLDLTANAAPSVGLLLDCIDEHKEELLKTFLDSEVSRMIFELRLRKLEYDHGAYKYMLLDIRKE